MTEISVIMPVCNGEQFIDEAIKSILEQTYSDFELVILNDGSTDDTANKIELWQAIDKRIKVIHRRKQGISASLNELISCTKSVFLARMDADDIAMPNRLATQLGALKEDKACGIIGSKVRLFGLQSGVWHFRQTAEQTKALALLGNTCLCHPSWMMRRDAISDISYSNEFPHMEDMHFLAQYILKANSKLYAIDDILLNYRVHGTSISSLQNDEQLRQRAKILAWTWTRLGIEFTESDPRLFIDTCYLLKAEKTESYMESLVDLLSRIKPQFEHINHCIVPELDKRLKSLAT